MLYDLCKKQHIPHKNCGKWIVAQDEEQLSAIEKVHEFSKIVNVPTKFISLEEGKRREPDVRARTGILESPTTGILDSHTYMQFLLGDFEDRGGVTALKSQVTKIIPIKNGAEGWEIWTRSNESFNDSSQDIGAEDETRITASTLINSAGLYAVPLYNSVVPEERQLTPFYAKGNYYSYSPSHPRPKILVYPAPIPGHAGLGTHLTLDMSGRVRFGPDVQWIDSPTDYASSDAHLEAALEDITDYLPDIDKSAVGLDYVGIRPKLGNMSAVVVGKGFQDFIIRKEEGFKNWINLLGIESPGLTSSLAIAEMVDELAYN
jgi:2-hydroxyglutarate dehydrogenase